MSRRIKNGLELSFHKPSKRWRRVIDGRAVYFGKGASEQDRRSYLEALTKYAEHCKQREYEREPLVNPPGGYVSASTPQVRISDAQRMLKQWGTDIAEANLDSTKSATSKNVSELIDLYLAEQRRRQQRRKYLDAQRDAGVQIKERQRENISDSTLRNRQIYSEVLRSFAGRDHIEDSEQGIDQFLTRWRDESERLLHAGDIMPNTFNERMKVGSCLIRWAHANYFFTALPRKMTERCSRYQYETTARAIDPETVRRIFHRAKNDLRVWICLAANAGYYSKDISVLRCEDVIDGYIVRDRNKTGVPTRYKLWKITRELLAPYIAARGSGVIFKTRKGNPLVMDNLKTNGRSDAPANQFRYVIDRLKIKGYSFSNLRDTSATFVEDWEGRAMRDEFLAHRDDSTGERYVDRSHLPNVQTRLDNLIDRLELAYGLTTEAPKAGETKAA